MDLSAYRDKLQENADQLGEAAINATSGENSPSLASAAASGGDKEAFSSEKTQ